MVKIILKPLLAEKMAGPVETGRGENMLSRKSLVLEIVQRVTDAGMPHSEVLINLVEQHGRQAGLPIMAMDYIRVLAALEDELQGGAAEKREALVVISLAV